MPQPSASESRQRIANATHSADMTFDHVERLYKSVRSPFAEQALSLARRLQSVLQLCETQIRQEEICGQG